MRISDWSSDVCSSDLGSTIKRRRYLLSHIRFLSGLALVALAVGMPASASVDSSPKPGGVYRLKPGLYVQKDVACAHAPNAAIRRYDGRAISDAHSRGCRAQIGRASCRKECVSPCRSRWSPYH